MFDAKTPPLIPMLQKLQLWVSLNEIEQEAVLALPHAIKTVQASTYIVKEGDRATHCCLLISGYVFRSKILVDGSRSILSFHMQGDVVDLQNALLGTSDHNVQTLTPATVALIPREAIIALAHKYPNIALAMWHDTLIDASIFREWIANTGRRNALARLAHLLCEFALRSEIAGIGKRTAYELPMTQEQLGDASGLTGVHVNRTLQAMQAEGLIARTKRTVVVVDWTKLARAADFNADYLHLRTETNLAA